jgi:hypothetical protein
MYCSWSKAFIEFPGINAYAKLARFLFSHNHLTYPGSWGVDRSDHTEVSESVQYNLDFGLGNGDTPIEHDCRLHRWVCAHMMYPQESSQGSVKHGGVPAHYVVHILINAKSLRRANT